MANLVYNEGKRIILASGLGSVVLGCMLVKATYTPNADTLTIDDGSANDPQSHEIVASGYARKTLANVVIGKGVNFAYLDADDTPFGGIATGDTISGIVTYIDTGGADTSRVPVMFFDLPDTPTNGSAITIQWAAASTGALLKAA